MTVILLLSACRPEEPPPHEPPPQATTEPWSPTTVLPPTTTTTTTTTTRIELTLDAELDLVVHAAWTEPKGVTSSRVEYRFDDDTWLVAPAIGPGEAVLLGIPEITTVEARAVWEQGGDTVVTETDTVTTGALPARLLVPRIVTWDPALASAEPYAMISIATGDYTYEGPYFLEIFDRQGRIVWYQKVPGDLFSIYPTPARDGTHLWFEQEDIFGFGAATPGVTRRTLDGRWSEFLPIASLGQAIAEGPDGSFFFERRGGAYRLEQLDAAGGSTVVWDCAQWMGAHGLGAGECLMNTCNWDEARDTVLVSQFESSTVFEIDVATGQPIRQMGQIDEGEPYAFDPPLSNFAYQHDPYWTPEGTLFVATHVPCAGGPQCSGNQGTDGVQLAAEYAVDDATRTLTRIWSYRSTDRWATQAGEAYRLANGNHVQGYGQDGAVREVTPDGEVAWEAAWDKDDNDYRFVGHLSLIADLYALNRIPE